MQTDQKTILCQKCEKLINSNNFMIHQAMCKGSRESYVIGGGLTKLKSKQSKSEYDKGSGIDQYPEFEEEQKDKEKKQEKEKEKRQNIPDKKQERQKQELRQKEKKKIEYPPLYQPEKRIKPNQGAFQKEKPQVPKPTVPIQKPKQPQQQQRFRCTDCGYMMTMKQLDSHPNECQARHKKCQYCNLEFPHYLMQMHLEVCQKLPNRREPRRPSNERQQIRQQLNRRRQEDQVQRNRVRPQRGTREGNIPANIIPVQQQTFVRREGNDRVTIRRVLGNNGRVYQERYREPMNQQQSSDDQEGGYTIIVPISGGNGGTAFINMQDLFSGSGGFQQIIRRLMNNMNINRQQNPGLSKQQIAKIPIIKYDPDSNPKSTSCTICVTDYEKGQQVMKLPCGHLFNPQCLVPWLKNSAVCPNCRGKVKSNN